MPQSFYSRVCWNSAGWTHPTGEAAKLELGSYVTKQGFGHEEWLFNFEWILNGYHYAYLQPVGRSILQLKGSTIDVLLWSISPEDGRVQVGEIRNCEILPDGQAEEAFSYYSAQGWLTRIREEVKRVEGKLKDLSAEDLFNVRFRPSDATQFGPPYPKIAQNDRIKKLDRYLLVKTQPGEVTSQWVQRLRQGTYELPSPRGRSRSGSGPVTVDPHHDRMQKELMVLLRERLGKEVVREARYVDITVEHGARKMLVEIKTYPSAKHAIREALGQILEYAFYWRGAKDPIQSVNLDLVIIGPGALDEVSREYLNFLRSRFHLPIRYCQFTTGGSLPGELLNPSSGVSP